MLYSRNLFFVSLLLVYYVLSGFPDFSYIFFLNIPLLCLCVYGILSTSSKFISLLSFFWLLTYLFFVVSPVQTFAQNTEQLVIFLNQNYGSVVSIAFALFIGYSAFLLGLLSNRSLLPAYVSNRIFNIFSSLSATPQVKSYLRIYLLCISSILAFLVYIFLSGGLSSVLLPRFEKVAEQNFVALFLLRFGQTICLYIFYFYRAKVFKSKLQFLLLPAFLVSILLLFVCQNPYNAPRFYLMLTWLPFVFLYFRNRINITWFFLTVLIVIVILFPILSQTTRFGEVRVDIIYSIQDFIRLPYFDAFEMFAFADYVCNLPNECVNFFGGYTSNLFMFAFPRSIFTFKSPLITDDVGSLAFILNLKGTTRLSMPFWASPHVDFSYLGSLIFGFLLGNIFKVLEPINFSSFNLNLSPNQAKEHYQYRNGISFVCLISALPIIMRGPSEVGLTQLSFLLLSIFFVNSFFSNKSVS